VYNYFVIKYIFTFRPMNSYVMKRHLIVTKSRRLQLPLSLFGKPFLVNNLDVCSAHHVRYVHLTKGQAYSYERNPSSGQSFFFLTETLRSGVLGPRRLIGGKPPVLWSNSESYSTVSLGSDVGGRSRQLSVLSCIVSIRYLVMTSDML
jgi:hypothetical protein